MNVQESPSASAPKSSFLTFCLEDDFYGIDTLAVEEIFLLPELTPIPEAARNVVGVFNLRGNILPVIDLKLRFGYPPADYTLTDSILVIKSEGLRVGLIVNQVRDVRNIAIHEITTEFAYQHDTIKTETIGVQAGIARTNEQIVILLNADALVRSSDETSLENVSTSELEKPLELRDRALLWRHFCPHATPEERAIFRQRAQHLRQAVQTEDRQGLRSLAVIDLEQESFGIDLAVVREFTDLSTITPIPCCPPHIVGNMNLRGEILTLVDIRHILNLPSLETIHSSKATIVEVKDIVAGIIVEQVHDIILVQPTDITAVPTAIHAIDDEYLMGTISYQGKMLALLDIAKILLKGELVVDES